MADMKPQGTQQYSVESGYESGDANVKAVVTGLAIILVATLVVMAAMFGMFNVLNSRLVERDEKIAQQSPALTARIVPPEPRLLPSPYTDEFPEVVAQVKKEGTDPARATEDVLPWDKRNLEIEQQYDLANASGTHTHAETNYSSVTGARQIQREQLRIPIADAMRIMAGSDEPSTPAIMTWQPEHPAFIAGVDEKGTMNLDPEKKNTDRRIFDDRPYWETQDEKFSSDSSGGRLLRAGELSR